MLVLAPAKVNLCLRVLGRRADGYHELDSIFLPLDLCDELELELRPRAAGEPAVVCACPGQPALDGDENLAARAGRLFLETQPRALALAIQIRKRIWTAAGLGGGSSDAAAILRALAAELGPPPAGLAALALRLGADVPFFLEPRPARVRGIGERLEPLAGVPSWPLLLVNPGRPLSTRAVFAELGLAPGAVGPSRPLREEELAALRAAPWRLAGNDLRAPALRLMPELASVEEALVGEGARAVALSGSGPTLFGIFDELDAARRAGERLRTRGGLEVAAAMTASS